MIEVKFLDSRASEQQVGYIPYWLSENNSKRAAVQLNDAYRFGGWRPFDGFKLLDNNSLKYPSDPPLRPLAEMHLRDELILVYESGWVAVIQSDRSFEVSRMD